jgi:uncharacterized 2Fe-2S/4Fe-4S cluster protein (DUF4445 family)
MTKDPFKTPCLLDLILEPPTLKNNTADADRLIGALAKRLKIPTVEIDLALLQKIPTLLRANNYKVRCFLFREREGYRLTAITHATDDTVFAGLAVDLGTSRVVLRLVDLATEDIIAESAFDNPQMEVGLDILARIHFCETNGGLKRLNGLIVNGLNREIMRLCQTCTLEPEKILSVAIAGNTAMTHFLMGLNPRWLIREPYIPVINRPGRLKAVELGIGVNPRAGAIIFPNIGSYFGGDLIAGILCSGLNQSEAVSILVDVGTNAEVVLGNRHWLIACAGAAGPALEGGVTKMGMMAAPGAIDEVAIDPYTQKFKIHTIGGLPPKGICGSGLIDLASQIFLAGMVDIRGKFLPDRCKQRLKKIDGVHHLVVVFGNESGTGSDLTLSQIDLDSLIRSKAAMYTILETIMESVGISSEELRTFYVAGTFGAFINPKSAVSIGMLPDLPLKRFVPLGNSSLDGATMALTRNDCWKELDRIRDSITYLELNVNQEFMQRFSAAKFLPHTDAARFPTVSPVIYPGQIGIKP